MITPPFRISAIGPSFTTPHYYFRDEEVRDTYNRPATRPLFSASASDAHKFHSQEAAVRFRDNFRHLFQKYRFSIERIADGSGPHFENEGVQPEVDSVDRREVLYVEPDGFEGSGLVFIVRPAVTAAHGRCWCLRAIDVPSLAQFHTSLETVYSPDPVECVRQAQQRWAKFNPQPFRPAELDAADTEELKRVVEKIKNQNRPYSRVRPGSVGC